MKISYSGKAPVLLAFAIASMAACSDSTGPTSLDSSAALQSLAIGLNGIISVGTPSSAEATASFDAIAPLLDKVSVTFDGVSQNMYAFALRESFPPGTCEEALLPEPFIPGPGQCTPPVLGVVTILWQSRSASQAPDKLVFIAGDVGNTNFDFLKAAVPAVAIYVTGQDKFYGSKSGTLTTQVTSNGQNCDIPLPPYAKTGTCSFATFTEAGTIVMSEITIEGATGKTLSLGLPAITLDGLWLNITEVQPVLISANRVSRGMFGLRGIVGLRDWYRGLGLSASMSAN